MVLYITNEGFARQNTRAHFLSLQVRTFFFLDNEASEHFLMPYTGTILTRVEKKNSHYPGLIRGP